MNTKIGKVIVESEHFRAELMKSRNRIDIRYKGMTSIETSRASIDLNDGKINMYIEYRDLDEVVKLIRKTIKILA